MYKKLLQKLRSGTHVEDYLTKAISHRPHSFQKPHVIFSAENPYFKQSLKMDHDTVVKMLKRKGYDIEELAGKYGGNPERSIMVKEPNPKHLHHFHDLARKLGQDSIIFSDGYSHELHKLGDRDSKTHYKGQGTDWSHKEPEDNYSKDSTGQYFLHNFNFDTAHGHGKSTLLKPHTEEMKKAEGDSAPKISAKNHPLFQQHPNINLVHYSPKEGLNIIDPNYHGERKIGSEAKQGAPEHKMSFYYLEGVKPESIVTSGSKTKNVTRLGNKKVYDISSDKDNLWEKAQKLADMRATNPGVVRREDYHQAIRNAGYHGIYNSGLDNTMSHAVGMFEPMEVEHSYPIHQNDYEKVSAKDHHSADAKKPQGVQHPNSYDWHDGHTSHHDDIVKKHDEAEKPKSLLAPTRNSEAHPHLQAHGPTEPKNEQAGNVSTESFHHVMQHYGAINAKVPSNLKFYKGLENHKEGIDKQLKQHGFEHYFAGGKFGKPDLANKNYNTKHLMVYDPTPQSGGDFGDQDFTEAWRKSHELAHALTYPEINSLYGEGRRLGKLGVRSPNEMKRAVHWEHLAAHKQRDLMKELGYHMNDEDFHKEYNTVMGDAVHRAVTGKFTEPSEMGFTPHSTHAVPLHHSLGMIDTAAKGLGLEHEHDTLSEMNKRKGLSKAEGDDAPKKPKLSIAPEPKAPKAKAPAQPAAPAAAEPAPIGATHAAPAKNAQEKEIDKVRGTLQDLKDDTQSTKGIFSRIYSIPSSQKMGRSKVAGMTGQVPRTINVYGSHYPVVRLLDDSTLLLHTSEYGQDGKTQELVKKIKSELPGIFPEAKVIEMHHPDYRHSAQIMRLRNHDSIADYLKNAAENHPDENYRQHALEAHDHIRNMKKGEFSKPIHTKRTETEGWDAQQNLDKRLGRLHGYLSKLGLTPDTHSDHGRSLGADSPTSLGVTIGGDPYDQQIIHEAAHAMLTPRGHTIQDYQQSIGKPGFQGKLVQTANREQLQAQHGGGMPEATAQQMEAGIARRAGVEPFRSPQRGVKADSSIELGRQHAKKTLELYDEGIQGFDPFTGQNETGSSVHAVINARARKDKGLFNQVHSAYKQRKGVQPKQPMETKLAASENQAPDLEKGFKQVMAGIGAAATLNTAAPTFNPPRVPAPQQKIQSDDFGSRAEDKFLHHIMQVETSGGKNLNHPLITQGLHKGHKAIGKFALMPLTLQETAKRYAMKGGQDKNILSIVKMDPHKIADHMGKNPNTELTLARQLARHVIKRHGDDTPNAAYAWKYGHNMSPKAINPDKRDQDVYVQKFNKLSAGQETQGLKPYRGIASVNNIAKEEADLTKGSLQSKNKFNPQTDVTPKDRTTIQKWQRNDGGREDVPELTGTGRTRALHKLSKLTQTRLDERTGERQFLLHRGMGHHEHTALEHGPHKTNTSWTPKLETANNFARRYLQEDGERYQSDPDTTSQLEKRRVSAWIPESHIHHYLPMVGSTHFDGKGKNMYGTEQEVIVKPHVLEFSRVHKDKAAKVHERINDRQERQTNLRGFGIDEGLMANQNPPKKLAASEKEAGDLFKAPLIMDDDTSDAVGSSGFHSLYRGEKHVATNKLKTGHYHHVVDDNGYVKHYLSSSADIHDKDSYLASVSGAKRYNGMQVSSSKVNPQHKGKGYDKTLYLAALAHHGEMDSDNMLTKRSHNVWSKLGELSNGAVNVTLANPTTTHGPDTQTFHTAKADQKKLRNQLFTKDIIKPTGTITPTKLAASETAQGSVLQSEFLDKNMIKPNVLKNHPEWKKYKKKFFKDNKNEGL